MTARPTSPVAVTLPRDRTRHGVRWSSGLLGMAAGLVVGLLVLAPVLRPGYTLSYDLVFVPRQPITAATLGLDGSVPRAVPTDLVVAGLSRVLPADAVEKLLLLAVFVLAGWAMSRLVTGRAAAVAAAVAYTWNPYVAERLVIGHWSLLLGYAMLPAAVGTAQSARRTPGRTSLACLWVFAAALCGATAGLIVALAVLAVLSWRPRHDGSSLRQTLVVTVAAVAANAPWWLPTLLRPGGVPADPHGIAAFAGHADTSLGLAASLFTLGGIWNTAVVPPERGVTGLVVVSLVVCVVVLVLSGRRVAAWWGGAGTPVLLTGLAGLLISAAASLPGLSWVLRVVVLHVPGGGLLRDGQKFLAPFALVVALCVGATVELLVSARRTEAIVAAVGLAVVPIVTLPGLAWGVAGRLAVATYPRDWFAVRDAIAASDTAGDVAVLPWYLYRRFPWNGDRVVLDPAQRFFPGVAVVNDDLPLTSGTIHGEDPRATAVGSALAHGAPLPGSLARLGVRFVVVEHHVGLPDDETGLMRGQRQLYAGTDLDLYELSGVRPWDSGVPTIAGAGLAACAITGLLAGGAVARRWHNHPRQALPDGGIRTERPK